MTPRPNIEQPDSQSPDSGFTLVELLVYSVLLMLVLVGAGTLLIQSLKGQQQVVGISVSSGDAQVAVRAVDRAVRNAAVDGIKIVDNVVLVAHSGGGDKPEDFVCQAWAYRPPAPGDTYGTLWTKTLRADTTRPPAARLDALGSAVASGGSTAGWIRLVDGVVPPSGGTSGPIFSGSLPMVTVEFGSVQTESAGDRPGTKVSSTTSPRPQAVSGNGGCFS